MSTLDDRSMAERVTDAFRAMGEVVTEHTAAPGRVPAESELRAIQSRTGRRWVLPMVAAAAVIVLLIGTTIIVQSWRSAPVRPSDSKPAQTPSTSAAASSLTTAKTSTPIRTSSATASTPSRPSPSETAPAGSEAPWTASSLIITATSLGAVKNGMTLAQAENAAGLDFPGSGNGAHYPTLTSPHAPHLYIRPTGDTNFPPCLGAQGDGKGTPTVSTAEGFRLGDPVRRLKGIYGSALTYTPRPDAGLSPRAGYTLKEPAGSIIFVIDPATDTITEIASSTQSLTPSGCPG
jgi:hypothetical protein